MCLKTNDSPSGPKKTLTGNQKVLLRQHNIAAKAVYIFGNDTMKIIEVTI